jgi:hypothetical protein
MHLSKVEFDVLLEASIRLAVLIHVPSMICIDDMPAHPVKEFISDNCEHVFKAIGYNETPYDERDADEDEDEDDEEEEIEFYVGIQNHLKREGAPVYIAMGEIQIPHNLERLPDDENEYNFSSWGWGYLRNQVVVGNSIEELVAALLTERNKMFAEIWEKEQAAGTEKSDEE